MDTKTIIKPEFAEEIHKYGAIDFNECYNCGTCTAVCNLSEKNASFPRIFIRYTQTGRKAEILSSKELWLCYACGDCSQSCPRQADPAELIAALRRYAIANYEPTGITKLMFKNNPIYLIIITLLAVILGAFLLTIKPETEISRWLFQFVSYETIHNLGLVIIALIILSSLFGMFKMINHLVKNNGKEKPKNNFWKRIGLVIKEIAVLKRYQTCDKEEDSIWHNKKWFVKPWFVHWSIMWGFIGLLTATILDFLFKDPNTVVWLPTRILGTISGLLLIYGSTLAIIYRLRKVSKIYEKTKLADWIFLLFIWLAGLTGFIMEIVVSFNYNTTFSHIMFLIHTVVSMELILLFAFSKFAHALYRPLALYFYFKN